MVQTILNHLILISLKSGLLQTIDFRDRNRDFATRNLEKFECKTNLLST